MGLFGEVDWISDSEHNLDTIIMPLSLANDLYIDGTFLYTINPADVKAAENLSNDGRFKAVKVKAWKLMYLGQKEKLHDEDRTSLAFTPKGQKTFLTPPIWKTLSTVGSQQLSRMTQDNIDDLEDSTTYHGTVAAGFKFDEIDQHLSVNLGFALKAGRELSDVFGYDVIEPLGLDDLMIQMRTVNLPNIANEVKSTYDTGFPFTHAVAWLIGLTNRTKTLDAYITLRTLLKHLTTKGVYRKGAFDTDSIFKDPLVVDVPLMTVEEAGKKAAIDFDTVLMMGRVAQANADTDISNGVLHDAV
jgi:hypothetical protein